MCTDGSSIGGIASDEGDPVGRPYDLGLGRNTTILPSSVVR